MFVLSNVSLRLKNKSLIHQLDFTLEPKKLTCLIGANGAGKSSLLKIMLGEFEQTKGRILFNARALHSCSLSQLSRQRAYVAQAERPIFDMKVYDYLLLAREHYVESKAQSTEWVERICYANDIAHLLDQSILSLSGGEFQMVSFTRAWLQLAKSNGLDNTVMLLDEPGSALDVKQADRFYQIVKQYVKNGGTALVIEHNVNLAGQYSDNLAILKHGKLIAHASTSRAFTKQNLDECFTCNGRIIHSSNDTYIHYTLA